MLAGAFVGAIAVVVWGLVRWIDGKELSRSNLSIVLIAVALAGAAWMARYDVTGISRGDQWPASYVLDRWTGDLVICSATKCSPTKMGSTDTASN